MLDPGVIVRDEGVPVSVVFGVFAGEIIVAEKAAFKPLVWRTLFVLAGCTATVEAHGALGVGKPFQSLSELLELEGFGCLFEPVVADSVNQSS